jgi:hypothetical protein
LTGREKSLKSMSGSSVFRHANVPVTERVWWDSKSFGISSAVLYRATRIRPLYAVVSSSIVVSQSVNVTHTGCWLVCVRLNLRRMHSVFYASQKLEKSSTVVTLVRRLRRFLPG